MPEPVYPARTAHLLAASRQRADEREQAARQSTRYCSWCGEPVTPGERCPKRMCLVESMGDSPSDYR